MEDFKCPLKAQPWIIHFCDAEASKARIPNRNAVFVSDPVLPPEVRRRLRQRLGHNGSEATDEEKLASSLGETNSWSVLGVEHFSGLHLATVTY